MLLTRVEVHIRISMARSPHSCSPQGLSLSLHDSSWAPLCASVSFWQPVSFHKWTGYLWDKDLPNPWGSELCQYLSQYRKPGSVVHYYLIRISVATGNRPRSDRSRAFPKPWHLHPRHYRCDEAILKVSHSLVLHVLLQWPPWWAPTFPWTQIWAHWVPLMPCSRSYPWCPPLTAPPRRRTPWTAASPGTFIPFL